MIVVCDVNNIWRRRAFGALADLAPVLAVAPSDRAYARAHAGDAIGVFPFVLPRGWASKTAWLGQRLLWRKIRSEAARQGKRVECVVVTSPHYVTLLKLLPEKVRTIYYASDDYRSYDEWENMEALEEEVVLRVDHAVFVSESLAERARREYKVPASKVSVCMNGTEGRFFPDENEAMPINPPSGAFTRPIAGVIGGICDRLDFELLRQCADLPELGTLLLIGPLPDHPSLALQELLKHPKVASVGSQPHGSIHKWFKCLDLGLLPYVQSEFNKHCSPMRLFDHLASGRPVVSTRACSQVTRFGKVLEVCDGTVAFVQAVDTIISQAGHTAGSQAQIAVALKQTWAVRAECLLAIITNLRAET